MSESLHSTYVSEMRLFSTLRTSLTWEEWLLLLSVVAELTADTEGK